MGDNDLDEDLFSSIGRTPIASVISNPRLPDNPLVAVNDAFCALTGYSRRQVIGRNCRFLSGRSTEETSSAVLRAAVAEGRSAFVEITNYKATGTPFRNAVMIAPVRGHGETVAYYIGSQMDLGQADTLSQDRYTEARSRVSTLTERQRQVLAMLIQGYRNKQIAGLLAIDEKTVKMHRARLLVKLGAPTSAVAIRMGVEAGLQPAHG